MGASLDDAPLLHDDDGVGIADGAQTVGDDEGAAPLHQRVHAVLYCLLRPGVDARCGLVEDECRRIGNGSAGDGDKLSLALTQIAAIGREHRLVAVGQTTDEVVGIDQSGRLDALLVGGVEASVADVLHHSAGEEMRLLQHDAKTAAQLFPTDTAYVDMIVENLSVLDVVEPVDEIGDGRLACTRPADKCYLLSGFGVELDVEEHLLARHHPTRFVDGRIAEVDAGEVDLTALARQAVAVFPCPDACPFGALL